MMTMYALVKEGQVARIAADLSGEDTEGFTVHELTPEQVASFARGELKWDIEGECTVEDVEALYQRKLAELAELRWMWQATFEWNGSITWAEYASEKIATKLKALDERIRRGETPGRFAWKLGDDEVVWFDRDELADFGLDVETHIQACFNREAELIEQIKAVVIGGGGKAEIDAIDIHSGWPGQSEGDDQ